MTVPLRTTSVASFAAKNSPKENQVITVEVALSPVPIPGPPESSLARVTRVVPGDKFPIRATEH